MPAPSRRNKGESLAVKIGDHTAAKAVTHDGDRMVAARTRQDKRWEEAAASLERPRSDLAERAAQARTDAERSPYLGRYPTAVREGRAKPAIVVLDHEAHPRYLGECLRCRGEMWVHSPKPRVPICAGCRS